MRKKVVFINTEWILISKLATLAFRKMKVFCNKGYDLIIFVHDATNKISSFESSYIGHVNKFL